MKRSTILIIFIFYTIFSFAGQRLDSLLNVLDKTINEHRQYVELRENRIQQLKALLSRNNLSLDDVYSLNKQLYNEYKAYVCDSAISYLNCNLDIAEKMNDTDKVVETKLLLSYLFASSGMYKESIDILNSIKRNILKSSFLEDYYLCYDHVYGELSFYTHDKRSSAKYSDISWKYKDSLYAILDKESELYLNMKETRQRDFGEPQKALETNMKRLQRVEFGTPEYALVTFHRALDYSKLEDNEQRKIYLALSAISDLHSAIKDNASLWELANLIYKDGDVDRSYKYIRHSLDDANFFNARLRNFQISGILSIIDKTYQMKSEKQKDELRFYLILISLLSVLLIAAIMYIYKQMNKLSVARNNLQDVNGQLNILNRELSEMNEQLKSANLDLSESNHVKEEYIGHFLSLCSTYIDKLESFRKMVTKKLTTGQVAELLKITKSTDIQENELKEFYANFDNTFLHLYPSFVEDFNSLLIDGEKIVLKKGELMNTELRIFALIRLGIDDSSKIADFLRYSVNTIYNYRAKVKNKAKVSREDFENLVMRIASFSK